MASGAQVCSLLCRGRPSYSYAGQAGADNHHLHYRRLHCLPSRAAGKLFDRQKISSTSGCGQRGADRPHFHVSIAYAQITFFNLYTSTKFLFIK